MANPNPETIDQSLARSRGVVQAELLALEPYITGVPIDVLGEGIPYSVSVRLAEHMSHEGGIAAIDAASQTIADLPRRDLVELTRSAVEQRRADDLGGLPETHRRRQVFAEGLLWPLLTPAERAEASGADKE